MTILQTVEPRLEWFIHQMRFKLYTEKNLAKGDWRDSTRDGLFDHLDEEMRELDLALDLGKTEDIIRECADIANLAMMLADFVHYQEELKNATSGS